jgi:hypothetical protein
MHKARRVETIDGIDWYYYFVPNKDYYSLIDKIGVNEINKKFIVCATLPNVKNEKKPTRLFSAYDGVLDFLNIIRKIPKEKWMFFEYIMGDQIQKLYFDIDIDIGKLVESQIITSPENQEHCKQQLDTFSKQLISSLAGRILTVFSQKGYSIDVAKQILIFSSHSSTKRSFHIVVDSYAVSNCEENASLACEILEPFPDYIIKTRILDPSMYSSKQQLRLYQSQKPGSGRPKIFMDEWYYGDQLIKYPYPKNINDALRFTTIFQASCITYIDACKIIPISIKSENLNKGGKRRLWSEMGTFDNTDEDLVNDVIIDAICQRADPKMFQIYKLERNRTIGTLIALNRRNELIGTDIFCTLCNRAHSSIGAFLRVNKHGKVYFYCYGNGCTDNKIVADVSDLLPSTKELECNQKQSIISQLKNNLPIYNSPNAYIPSPITLHSQMRTIASTAHK